MIKPLGKNILVKPDKPIDKTASGLYIPDSAQDTPDTGLVAGVGSLVEDVKVGDRVLYKKYHHKPIKFDGEDYAIIDDTTILGVFE